jgi:DNA-binding transcriptional MerR regulator
MMQRQLGGLRRIKSFATEAGVSVRTLHLYDRLGLLAPAAASESGYRLYGEAELERLEHILALRFVGLRLDQIKELLGGSDQPLVAALRMQREVIARQKRQLESALTLIDEAERALTAGGSVDRWKILRTVMEAFKMQNDWKWTQEYYSEAARERVDERRRSTPAEVIEQGQRDWTALIARPRFHRASNRPARMLEDSRSVGAIWWRRSRSAIAKFSAASIACGRIKRIGRKTSSGRGATRPMPSSSRR